ncbi:uncharacterized protein LOC112682120 [Sipha flava]|uniref:Uncharacterized protein LOC112682120 n=2 Tax=Sipha flava TaxID=143950 RepID=A0A8B8FDI0_9HEMI|nr:uncharacterized protein LOC112682120 [Sipha flava]
MFGTTSCWTAVLLVVAAVAGQTVPGDREDQRQAKGVQMFGWHLMEGAKRSCVGPNGRPGVCMSQNDCSEMKGKSVGRCFPYDSCCSITPNSCGGYSGSSTTYFQSPDTFQELCTYKIHVRQNTCQLRIDFERFSLSQPTKPNNESAYVCEHDEFTLVTNGNTKMNLPVLCGKNSGQHVYVPVNEQASTGSKTKQHITLKFRLTARDEDYTEQEPFWKLKISQLECQTTSTNWWKIKDIARQVWDWEEEERDVTKTKYSLAPEGCLQYYTEKDGSFESFNYNKGMGHYLGNLNYAVCFKRNQDTCGIRYEAVKFQVAYNRKLTGSTDRDCDTAAVNTGTTTRAPQTTETTTARMTTTAAGQTTLGPDTVTTTAGTTTTENTMTTVASVVVRSARRRKWSSDVHSDYLLIPDGHYSGEVFASKYCDKSLETLDDITVKTQGPLYVAFVSDDYSNPEEDVEKGFRINYSLTNTGC